MAALRQGQNTGWGEGRQVQGALVRIGASFRAQDWHRDQPRRLPPVLGGAPRIGVRAQHNPHRSGIAARLPSVAVPSRSAPDLDTASIKAARSLADQGGSADIGGRSRDATHQTVRDLGAFNRGEGRGNLGPDLGPRGLHAWHDRLPAIRSASDKQAPHCRSDEHHFAASIGGSLRGPSIGSCDRVRGQACGIGKKGNAETGSANRYCILAARSQAYVRGVDGTGERANAEDCAVPGAHIDPRDGSCVRPLFAVVYAGCERRRSVLSVQWYTWGQAVHSAKSLKTWWALTGSNRRPSRCKRKTLTQIWAFSRIICVDFRNIPLFCSRSGTLRGTHVHIGPEADCSPPPALTNTEHRRFDVAASHITPGIRKRKPAKIRPILHLLQGDVGAARIARFWAKVSKAGANECWPWTGCVTSDGYGCFKLASYTNVTASRMAIVSFLGREPDGLHVLHQCDNPTCCNPWHLKFGTIADNADDRVRRGRARGRFSKHSRQTRPIGPEQSA